MATGSGRQGAAAPQAPVQPGLPLPHAQLPGQSMAPAPHYNQRPGQPIVQVPQYQQQPAPQQNPARVAQYSQEAAQQYRFDPADWVMAAWGLSKWYGMVLGLNNITLGIRPGITGLLGPNGAGKSTFMKLVTGQLVPSQGRLWVLGQNPRNNTRLKARIGYCPEQDSFYPWMTGLKFVEYLARLQGMAIQEANAAARKAIAAVDMTADMNRRLGGYSKGMRQRIKVAQSIVHEPELVILDEPLGGTDPIARVRIMEVISDLEKAGRMVLISSHVLHEVERMTENIVLIHKGMLLAQGNLHDIRDLIDKHPHTIMISTPEPRRLAAELDGLEFVASLDFLPGQLTVRTAAPEAFYRELPRIIARTGIPYTGLLSPDDNLNAVFKYLTEG